MMDKDKFIFFDSPIRNMNVPKNWDIQLKMIGKEKKPVLIIDNFHPTPSLLVEDSGNANFNIKPPYYPGHRAIVKAPYLNLLMPPLTEPLVNFFGFSRGAKIKECFYSILSTPPQKLNMVQRVPHVDGGQDKKIALLHYLCGPEFGGTAFYQQVNTGFETVTNDRFKEYDQGLHKDHNQLGPSKAEYFNKSDERFKKIYQVSAKFNRAIIYFSCNLHTVIPGNTDLTDVITSSPRIDKKRLTINTFIIPNK